MSDTWLRGDDGIWRVWRRHSTDVGRRDAPLLTASRDIHDLVGCLSL